MRRPTDLFGRARTGVGLYAVLAILVVGSLLAPAALAQTGSGFEIGITDAPEEADVGEEITVEATVENVGESADNGTVTLEINGNEVDTASTETIEPNGTDAVEFTYTIEEDLPDETGFTVSIGDAEATGTFAVNRGSQFTINIIDGPPESVSAGETIELTAEIENTGSSGETTVSFKNSDQVIESRSVEFSDDDTTNETFSYSTTERDLGTIDLVVEVADGSNDNRPITVGLPEGDQFAAARTSPDYITVTLAESAVGSNRSVQNGEITFGTDSGDVQWTWNMSASTPENGLYQHRLLVPGAEDIDDASLVGATVSLGDTGLSDEADLHTVESVPIGGWADDGTLYLPVETVGVTNTTATDVSVAFSGGTLEASFVDSRTVAIRLGTFREGIDPDRTEARRFETDGAPVGSAIGTQPEIRYLHGEIVLWHPHIQDGVEHTVTIYSIDDAGNETSTNATAVRDGAIPVPNAGEVAGADSVTVSVGNLLDERTIDGPSAETASLNATLLDGGTVRADRNLELLSVSSVLVEIDANATYLSGDDVSVDGGELRLSGVSLEGDIDEMEVLLATDAGIVDVQLSPPESGSILYMALFGLVIVLGTVVTAVAGFFAGEWRGVQNWIEVTILTAFITFSVVILLLEIIEVLGVFSLPVFFEPWILIGATVVALFGISYAVGHKRAVSKRDERGRAGTRQRTTRRRVSVTDGTTLIKQDVEIVAVRDNDRRDRRTSTVRDGTTHLELPRRTWRITAELDTDTHTYTSDPVRVDFRQGTSPIELEIELPGVSVAVQDEKRDSPIPDASVRMEVNGETETETTGDDGRVRFDPPPEAEAVTLVATHDKYEDATAERQLSKTGLSETIRLRPRPGQLRVRSRIDGVDVGGMDIEITPDEDALERIYKARETIERTTDENGEYANDELLVGSYRVGLGLPERIDHLFETAETRAVVEQPAETVTVEARFTWDLSTAQRNRIERIREDLRNVTARSGIDVVLPQYYVSVVESVLEGVESFPEQGHHFAEIDADPDTVADATLDAAAEATETIAEAMSTKRNMDLFTACSDMADAHVRWSGTFDIETLAERLNADPIAARRAFAARADEVSERIDTERGSLSEIAPAREMFKRVGIDGSGGGVEGVVSIHVSILLLDAIEELFEHQELTERLSRTVF